MLTQPSTAGSTPSPSSSATAAPSCDQPSSNSENDHDALQDWRPPFPLLCAFHDCLSLATAWSLGSSPALAIDTRPTGASQAQSPCEDDAGDGKSNQLLLSCPAFRNELGVENVRRLALSRLTAGPPSPVHESADLWLREATAAEVLVSKSLTLLHQLAVLEDVSNVYLGGRLCAARQPKNIIEPQDTGSYYFRHCFAGRQHVEYVGNDEELGPIVVSTVKETVERKNGHAYSIFRLVIRISDRGTMRVAVPEEALSEPPDQRSQRSLVRELLELACPKIHFSSLRPALQTPRFEELLMKVDEQPIYTRYKVGVILCLDGQSTEEQMYNNEFSTPAFDEFLDFLGQKIRLKGWDQYKGGLDTKGDTTGVHSIYAEYQAHEIMFHVSTMLPFTPSNKQQLSRKRHIGNDMVTIVFQESGALPFSPITVRSHFQHVFIVIRVHKGCTDKVNYSVAVSRSKDVPPFGPPIPSGANFQKCAEFHDWLMTKIINAENAVHRSTKFAAMAARTRREALRDLAENHAQTHSNEGPSRIASRFLGGSVKRSRDKIPVKPTSSSLLRGALSWLVDVHDHSLNSRVSCILGLSSENLVLLERPAGVVIFSTPTHSILGWANTDMGLKLYYDHGEMLLMRCCTVDGTDKELNSLLERLEAVTKAKEIVLRKAKRTDSLGFHMQEEGIVTDVEMYQTAWKAGLRQGSRILEIDSELVSTLNMDRMLDTLYERDSVRMLLLGPGADGSPRRGCEDPNCPAVRGLEDPLLTPDAFAKQPLSYQEVARMRTTAPPPPPSLPSTSSASSSSSATVPEEKFYRTVVVTSDSSSSVPIVVSKFPPSSSATTEAYRKVSVNSSCYAFEPRLPTSASARSGLHRAQSSSDDAYADAIEENQVAAYRRKLDEVQAEKVALEATLQQLRSQLLQEKRSHDSTRKELEKCQEDLKRVAEKR